MADDYIDYFEIREYTDHFLATSSALVGSSKTVDVTEVQKLVSAKADAVDTELAKQGVKRGNVRSDRKEVEEKRAALEKEIRKFYSHLDALDDAETFDREAFFPGGNLGSIAQLKPADLEQRANAILRGFDAQGNASFTGRDDRKTKIAAAQEALNKALGGKGNATLASIKGTAELLAARSEWLNVYTGVKRIILGLLTILGRKDEHRHFFKDLQVNEGGPRPGSAESNGSSSGQAPLAHGEQQQGG